MTHVTLAFRALLEHRGFSAVVILTIAVGIGANTAIFSVYDQLVLHAVTAADPSSLVAIWFNNPQRNVQGASMSVLVAALACVPPSLRASRIDPLVALRAD